MMTPTDEQAEIIRAVNTTGDNIMIRAYAGTGKSATLRLIDEACGHHPHLYLVFNKKNAEEAREPDANGKPKFRSTTMIKNFNSLGHRIWADHCGGKLNLNPKKLAEAFRKVVDDATKSDRSDLWEVYDTVTNGVNLARAFGYIPPTHAKAAKALINAETLYKLMDENPSPLARELIDSILIEIIRQSYAGLIDFADQCYMPALFGGMFPQFPIVFVDEYQDLSPVQHEIVRKLCVKSRQIGVGDECQSIYAFRGANASGMADAITKFNMKTYDLSISFRCPSVIVDNVRWRVPKFRASREGGAVYHKGQVYTIEPNSTVICRNNAPLLANALHQLGQGRSVNVSGTNMGDKIIRQMSKLGPIEMSRAHVLAAIEAWEVERLLVESKTAAEMAACMRIFAKTSQNLGGAMAYARHLFAQTGSINYITGHRSKGLEFDHVYHLDQHLLTQKHQDPNIRYVIDTRARETLSYIGV